VEEGRVAKWTFEPGHSAAEFCVRHMMVTWVRGQFKNVSGWMELDLDHPAGATLEVTIPTQSLNSGEPARDAHLRSADFLDVERYPTITFKGETVRMTGKNDFVVLGKVTIRGVTREIELDVTYLGQWATPYWENGVDKGPIVRAGFVARARLDRRDFGVSWNAPLERDGVVVGNDVLITIDVEALLDRAGE
jgi:polyisoprenoid-binding protein YceI